MSRSTDRGELEAGPASSQHNEWQQSWLFAWLIANCQRFRFVNLVTEEWHYDHEPSRPRAYEPSIPVPEPPISLGDGEQIA